MKKLFVFPGFLLFAVLFLLPGCETDPEDEYGDSEGKQCSSNSDCPLTQVCNPATNKCVDPDSIGDAGNTGNTGNTGDTGNTGNTGDTGEDDSKTCKPGETEKCPYSGPPETEGIGQCKASERTCKEDGTWGYCEGEVLPVEEIGDLCSDGIDNDCSGYVDRGVDWDGDGVPACEDCCEFEHECPYPAEAWDAEKHFCSFDDSENQKMYVCDDQITPGTNDPMQYAKAIGLCHTATDDPSSGWGVISAEILKPDGSFGAHQNSNGLLNALGNTIKPFSGNYLLALTSGRVGNPFPEKHFKQNISSGPPADWYSANGNKLPDAPGCSSGSGDSVNDPVMFKLRIRVPKGVQSFSFDIYFLSIEFPQYVCTTFNDFFVALLDSGHTSEDPELQNPFDKNLAMDENNYPVGVNLAKSGLFKICPVSSTYPSCTGTTELNGTGFEDHGATGWLTVRGNVVPGETMTLRLAIWDTGDHIWDSMVLIDNFRWEFEEFKPGTGDK